MGSRTAETLKEIDQIRARLADRFVELEGRMPDVARHGKRLVAMVVGGGAGGGALLFALRRLRRRGTRAASGAPVTVNVLPRGTGPLALAIALVWAGVRLAEARLRADGRATGARKGELHIIPQERRA